MTGKEPRTLRIFSPDKIVLILVAIYFLVPLVATLAFGLSDGKAFSLQAFQRVFSDPDFTSTLLLSLELADALRVAFVAGTGDAREQLGIITALRGT